MVQLISGSVRGKLIISYLVPKRKRRLQQQLVKVGQHQPYSSFCYTPVWIINNTGTDLVFPLMQRVQCHRLLKDFSSDWHVFHPYLCLRRIMRIKLLRVILRCSCLFLIMTGIITVSVYKHSCDHSN